MNSIQGTQHTITSNNNLAVPMASAASISAGMVGLGIGMGLPSRKNMQEQRRVQRRTSDFFAESLAMTPSYGYGGSEIDHSNYGGDY
jgi:hypothetical protein